MFHQFVVWLASTVGQWGYPGIVMLIAMVVGCDILVIFYWRRWKVYLPQVRQWEK
jgi:hypothetical protein